VSTAISLGLKVTPASRVAIAVEAGRGLFSSLLGMPCGRVSS
jgi:hypothetical protein